MAKDKKELTAQDYQAIIDDLWMDHFSMGVSIMARHRDCGKIEKELKEIFEHILQNERWTREYKSREAYQEATDYLWNEYISKDDKRIKLNKEIPPIEDQMKIIADKIKEYEYLKTKKLKKGK